MWKITYVLQYIVKSWGNSQKWWFFRRICRLSQFDLNSPPRHLSYNVSFSYRKCLSEAVWCSMYGIFREFYVECNSRLSSVFRIPLPLFFVWEKFGFVSIFYFTSFCGCFFVGWSFGVIYGALIEHPGNM
jgi:hypothetical protein